MFAPERSRRSRRSGAPSDPRVGAFPAAGSDGPDPAACHSSGSNTTSRQVPGSPGPRSPSAGAPGDGQVNHQARSNRSSVPSCSASTRQPTQIRKNFDQPASSIPINEAVPTSSSVSAGRLVSSRHTSAGCPVGAVLPRPGSRLRSPPVDRDAPAGSPLGDTGSGVPGALDGQGRPAG